MMASLGNTGSASIPMVMLAPKTKTKKKHFVQQKVKVFRASDPMLSVFMWGVNHSVRRYMIHLTSYITQLPFYKLTVSCKHVCWGFEAFKCIMHSKLIKFACTVVDLGFGS